MQILEHSGLVRNEKQARVRNCGAEDAAFALPADWLATHHPTWETKLDRLGA